MTWAEKQEATCCAAVTQLGGEFLDEESNLTSHSLSLYFHS